MKHRKDLRILLIQVRYDRETIIEELAEFARFGRISEEQFDLLNLFHTPSFEPQIADGYDAIFIGGSSDASVCQPERYPFVLPCERLLAYCVEQSIPVLASCFGFQVVTAACGGKVIQDKENQEMGIFPIYLEPEASSDPLLHDLPNPFYAVSGHQDRALYLPEGFSNLASSARCPYHILRVDGKPFYGTQFHPEVDHLDFQIRMKRYTDRYELSDEENANIQDSIHPTEESNALIGHFIDRIVLAEQWRLHAPPAGSAGQS
jgi:GMP synthase (glutamine-hydrolysing)